MILDENAWARVLVRFGKGDPLSSHLNTLGLLPLRDDHLALPALLRLFGYLLGDGTAFISRGKGYAVFYGDPEGLEEVQRDLARLGFPVKSIHRRLRDHSFREQSFTNEECSLKVSATSFVLMMHGLGLPLGNKAKQDFALPAWLYDLPPWQRANFLAGLFGAELTAPRTVPRHGYNFQPPVFSQSKREAYRSTGREFVRDVTRLAETLGAEVQDLREEADWIAPDGSESVRFKLIFRATPQNFRLIPYAARSTTSPWPTRTTTSSPRVWSSPTAASASSLPHSSAKTSRTAPSRSSTSSLVTSPPARAAKGRSA
jgi:tRNA-splicing ligase RtcB